MYFKIQVDISSKATYLLKAETRGRARQEAISLAMDEFIVLRSDIKNVTILSACCDEFGKCCLAAIPPEDAS